MISLGLDARAVTVHKTGLTRLSTHSKTIANLSRIAFKSLSATATIILIGKQIYADIIALGKSGRTLRATLRVAITKSSSLTSK